MHGFSIVLNAVRIVHHRKRFRKVTRGDGSGGRRVNGRNEQNKRKAYSYTEALRTTVFKAQ